MSGDVPNGLNCRCICDSLQSTVVIWEAKERVIRVLPCVPLEELRDSDRARLNEGARRAIVNRHCPVSTADAQKYRILPVPVFIGSIIGAA